MELLLDTLKWSVIVGAAALALTLLKPLLDRRYSAKWRYGVWLVMAAFLLLAPVRWEALIPERAAAVEPPVVIEVPKVEVSVSPQEGVAFQRPSPAASRPAGTEAVKRQAVFPLEKILAGLWLAGMGLFAAYHLVGTWYFNRKARRWSRCAGEDTLLVYGDVWRELGLKKAPPLRVSGAVDSPMVIGLFRPCLMLPGEDFGAQELAFILRHELTHYRRRDLWYKLALLAANGMHWFNPLVWLLRREAERDLELTCDDAVVAGRSNLERRAYSEALLASIHRQKGLRRAVLSTHFYGGKEVMMERFRNILGKRGRKWGVLALALALLATVAAACAVGVKASDDGTLSAEELAEWQEKANTSLGKYLWCMYTDVSQIPSEECIEATKDLKRSYQEPSVKVLSGTKSGETITLELEGDFSTNLSRGTLTLVNEEPVSFTTPLYTAVETAALEMMDAAADVCISESDAYGNGGLEFTEKYITSLSCTETMEIDGKTYYVWELFYRMKPNDLDNIFFAGGMAHEDEWLTESMSSGRPIIIASMDEDGSVVVEERTDTSVTFETGFTWEEYIYCHTDRGMSMFAGILNGWPELNTPFLESLRDGHETWVLDWQDVAISYLGKVYGIYADSGFSSLRTFQGDPDWDHDEAVLAQAVCGDRTVTLLLAHVRYPVEVWDTTMSWWQVVGEKWEPDAPELPQEPDVPQTGELTADELASITSYFNVRQHNGLLRFPYSSLGTAIEYMGLLFYDMGNPVTDEEELAAVAALYGGELFTDCTKLTREEIRAYLSQNFTHESADIFAADLELFLDAIPSYMTYLEVYDACYMVHGDTLMTSYAFDRAERDADGTVYLYYTTDLWRDDQYGHLDLDFDQPMCARIMPNGNEWKMLSNERAE